MTVLGGTGTQAIAGTAAPISILGGIGGLAFAAGSGSALVVTGVAADHFAITSGTAASLLIAGFRPGTDSVQLLGFPAGEAAHAVSTQSHAGGSTVLLSDGSIITFAGLASVPAAAFL